MPEAETEAETVITVRVDERTRREAEAHLRPFGLTASQLFDVLLEGMARQERLATILAQWANSVRPPPIIPKRRPSRRWRRRGGASLAARSAPSTS